MPDVGRSPPDKAGPAYARRIRARVGEPVAPPFHTVPLPA